MKVSADSTTLHIAPHTWSVETVLPPLHLWDCLGCCFKCLFISLHSPEQLLQSTTVWEPEVEIRWPSTSPAEPQGPLRWWNIPSAAMDWVLWPVEGIGTVCLEGLKTRWVSEERGESEGGKLWKWRSERKQRVSQVGPWRIFFEKAQDLFL